jgi:hypothetical protein
MKSIFAFLQSTVIFQIDSKSSGTRYYLSFNSDRRTLFVSFPNEKIVIGKQMKLDTTGVNFTNVLSAAFTHSDPKSAKKTVKLSVFFAHSGSAHVKAARRTLMKLTSDAAEGWFILAGNGKPCLGNKPCGDGGLAVEANLAFPKVSFIGSFRFTS